MRMIIGTMYGQVPDKGLSSTTDPWKYLEDTSLINDAFLNNVAKSITGILLFVGAAGAVITIMTYTLLCMFGRNQKLQEFKEVLGQKLVMVVGLFAFTFIAGLAKAVAEMFI